MREIVLPQLAMGMSEGTIVEWCVAEGERIERDAPLVSIETEKVVVEIVWQLTHHTFKEFLHLSAWMLVRPNTCNESFKNIKLCTF